MSIDWDAIKASVDSRQPKDRFYVYTYTSSLNGRVFYVGKGTNDRYIQHIKDARKVNIKKVTPVILAVREIWGKGGKVIIRKVHKYQGDTKSLVLEQKLIEHYGYEQLVNRPYRNKYTKPLPYKSVV